MHCIHLNSATATVLPGAKIIQKMTNCGSMDPNFILNLTILIVELLLDHSMLRLDATTKKRYDSNLFKFKKNSIK